MEEYMEKKKEKKSGQPKRKSFEVERTFQESVQKPVWNYWQTYPKNYWWLTWHQTRRVYSGRTWSSMEKIKNRKAAGLDKISTEVWKIGKFDNLLLQLFNTVNKKKNTIEKWMKGFILLFPKKG